MASPFDLQRRNAALGELVARLLLAHPWDPQMNRTITDVQNHGWYLDVIWDNGIKQRMQISSPQ